MIGKNKEAVTLLSLKLVKRFLLASNEFPECRLGFPKKMCILLYLPELELPHMANLFPSKAAYKSPHQYNGKTMGSVLDKPDFEPQI